MLYNNQGSSAKAGVAAERAVASYAAKRRCARPHPFALAARRSRCTAIALRRGDSHAEQALERARGIGDRRLLAATLLHCASVFSRSRSIEPARSLRKERALYRSLSDDEGTVRALDGRRSRRRARASTIARSTPWSRPCNSPTATHGCTSPTTSPHVGGAGRRSGARRCASGVRTRERSAASHLGGELAGVPAAASRAPTRAAPRACSATPGRDAPNSIGNPTTPDVLLEERLTAELRTALATRSCKSSSRTAPRCPSATP